MPTNFLILVLDDDPDLGIFLEQIAKHSFPEARFHQVFSLGEATAYINQLEGYGPKLILLDLDLKTQQTGLDFLRYIRSHAQARLLPVVMLSVSQQESDILASYKLGANSYLVKPLTAEEWVTHLSTLRLFWLETSTLPPVRFTRQL